MAQVYKSTLITEDFKKKIQEMPKVELHVHLEGATDAATIWDLAIKNGVNLPAKTLKEWETMYAFRDFNHFIEIYHLAARCMQDPEDFRFMVVQFMKKQAAQNIKYCEAFVSASIFVDKFKVSNIIDALYSGITEGEAETGMKVRFIFDIARQLPETKNKVLEFALQGREKGIVIGLGLGGIETGYPPALFADVYKEARNQGLHVVAHAGETQGPESIWGALKDLKVERIGHGIRAIEDEALMEHLVETQIPLEVSPYSNYRLKVVPEHQQHPIRELHNHGIQVTVNSDDPPMFSTDLSKEYILLAQQGFSWKELRQLNKNAIEASFLSKPEKALLRQQLDSFSLND